MVTLPILFCVHLECDLRFNDTAHDLLIHIEKAPDSTPGLEYAAREILK